MFDSKTILITGGTGSFGNKFVEIFSKKFKPKKLLFIREMSTNKILWLEGFQYLSFHL